MPKENQFSAKIRSELSEKYEKDIFVQLHCDAPMSGRKPYDAYFVYDGQITGMEFKKTDGYSINFNAVSNNQVTRLLALDKAGGIALIIIWFWKVDAAIAVDIKTWIDIKETFLADGITNLKFTLTKELIDKDDMEIKAINRRKVEGKLKWEVEKLVAW